MNTRLYKRNPPKKPAVAPKMENPILLFLLMNHPVKIASVKARIKMNTAEAILVAEGEIGSLTLSNLFSRAFNAPRTEARSKTARKVIPAALAEST